jgi:hypothetical protein
VILPLRRRHRRVWLALALLLPLLYAAALLVRPDRPVMQELPPALAAPP